MSSLSKEFSVWQIISISPVKLFLWYWKQKASTTNCMLSNRGQQKVIWTIVRFRNLKPKTPPVLYIIYALMLLWIDFCIDSTTPEHFSRTQQISASNNISTRALTNTFLKDSTARPTSITTLIVILSETRTGLQSRSWSGLVLRSRLHPFALCLWADPPPHCSVTTALSYFIGLLQVYCLAGIQKSTCITSLDRTRSLCFLEA